jgi:hypothetical protein
VAAQRGLPVIEALGYGIERAVLPRRGVLIGRWLTGARSLGEVLGTNRGEGERELLVRLGALIRQAHERGVFLRDFHPGNVLVDAAGELWLIDLHQAVIDPWWREAAGRRVLLQAGLGLGGRYGPLSEHYRAFAEGHGSRAWEIVPAFLDFRRRFLRRRVGRCLRTCSEFVREGKRVVRAREFTGDLHALVATLPTGEVLRAGRRGRVVRVPWPGQCVFAKLRSTRHGRQLWRAHYALQSRGAAVAPAMGLVESVDGAWVLHQQVGDGEDLYRALSDVRAVAGNGMGLVSDFARSVARCHALGLVLRDLKLQHSMVDRVRECVVLVDLDGVREAGWLGFGVQRAIGGDLGRLLVSADGLGDRRVEQAGKVFLREYLREHRRLGVTRKRSWWRAVGRFAIERAARWRKEHLGGS